MSEKSKLGHVENEDAVLSFLMSFIYTRLITIFHVREGNKNTPSLGVGDSLPNIVESVWGKISRRAEKKSEREINILWSGKLLAFIVMVVDARSSDETWLHGDISVNMMTSVERQRFTA